MKQIVRVSLTEFLKYSGIMAGIMLIVFLFNTGLSMDLSKERSDYLVKYLFLGWGWVSMVITVSYLPIFARQALTMGKTRRQVLHALPAMSVIAALAQMIACFLVGLVMRIIWGAQFPIEQVLGAPIVLFVTVELCFAFLGQIMGVLGMRFGAKGIWISMGAAAVLGISLVLAFVFLWPQQAMTIVIFFLTGSVWQVAAVGAGIVVVMGIVAQAVATLLLRNFSVK